MIITPSEHDTRAYWVGYDDELGDVTLEKAIYIQYGQQNGADYDGIDRCDAKAADTKTVGELEVYSDLRATYEHVELVRLRPAR